MVGIPMAPCQCAAVNWTGGVSHLHLAASSKTIDQLRRERGSTLIEFLIVESDLGISGKTDASKQEDFEEVRHDDMTSNGKNGFEEVSLKCKSVRGQSKNEVVHETILWRKYRFLCTIK
jgi:hypothetical protein